MVRSDWWEDKVWERREVLEIISQSFTGALAFAGMKVLAAKTGQEEIPSEQLGDKAFEEFQITWAKLLASMDAKIGPENTDFALEVSQLKRTY